MIIDYVLMFAAWLSLYDINVNAKTTLIYSGASETDPLLFHSDQASSSYAMTMPPKDRLVYIITLIYAAG